MSKAFDPIVYADIEWRGNTPFSRQFNDVYFSSDNGVEESRYVFLEGNRLQERFEALTPDSVFHIGELGFGTGLNFIACLALWRTYAPIGARLKYFSCEKYPLRMEDMGRCLQIFPEFSALYQECLAYWPVLTPGWHMIDFPEGNVQLCLMLEDALSAYQSLQCISTKNNRKEWGVPAIDAWFLDGFAPSNNAEMWQSTLMTYIARLSKPGTSLSTFTVAREVKDALQSVDCVIEKRKGYGRKREMLLGRWVDYANPQQKEKLCYWHFPYSDCSGKDIMIVGAGLAGCFLAYAFAKRGWKVTVMDAQAFPGTQGSGNIGAVTFPHISAYRSPLSLLMLQAWQYATRFYQEFLDASIPHALDGLIQLREAQSFSEDTVDFLAQYPELAEYCDAERLSIKAGVDMRTGGLFFKSGGWFDSHALCQKLVSHPNINWQGGINASRIVRENGGWSVEGRFTKKLVLANAYGLQQFSQTNHFPIKAIRGQLSHLKVMDEQWNLHLPICGKGHIVPLKKDCIGVGATYHLGDKDVHIRQEDTETNIHTFHQLPMDKPKCWEAFADWVGVRTVSLDYLPLVGPVFDPQLFAEEYQGLVKTAKARLATCHTAYDDLYVFTGFGSRGTVSIPYCSEWLASALNQEITAMPTSLQQAISPGRFLFRNLIRKQKS